MIQKRLFKLSAVVTVFTIGLLLSSCKPEEGLLPSPSFSVAKNYVGTFVGYSSCDTGIASITVNAGTDKTKAYFHAFFGEVNCRLITKVHANIKGDSLSIPFTTYQDHCFNDYSIQGGAIYRNDSIFLSITSITEEGTSSCFFMGRKIPDTSAVGATAAK